LALRGMMADSRCCVVPFVSATGGSAHRNPLACAVAIYESHGLGGFWRGWLANYARLGPQTVMTFLVVEQLRHMAGMEPL
jgi:solute carrier family 25 uncoupling protein 8/9